MSEWKNIDSAPKDGTRVITLNIPNEAKTLPSLIKISYFRKLDKSNFMYPGFWVFEGAEGPSYEPTHWKPLPKQPLEGLSK